MFGYRGRVLVFASTLVFCVCLFPVCVLAQRRASPPPRRPVESMGDPNNFTFPNKKSASHAEDEPSVVFKTETVLIQVPVVVNDKSGNHVLNLKKDDFQVLENGKEQKIETFEEVVASKSRLSAAKARPDEFSNLAVAQGEQPRSIALIVLDTVNTPFLDQTYARKELLKYLAHNLDSNQVFGLVVITSRGLRVVQGLTGDSKQLIEALNRVSSETPAMTAIDIDVQAAAATGDIPQLNPLAPLNQDMLAVLQDFVIRADAPEASFQQERAIETTMQAFLGIAWSLSGIPGKKSVIWATGGMPFYIDSPSAVPSGYLSSLYERTMATLNEANISVYPVDVRGLVNFMPGADASGSRMARDTRPTNVMRQISNRSWLEFSTTDTLKEFAAMTGGRAFYNSNDISGSFKRAAEDSSSYYLLGYYLDTKNTKAGWRKLKVKLREKNKENGAEVLARGGFFVTNATVNPDTARKSDLEFAVVSPFDSTGLPVTVRWLGTSPDGNMKKVQFGLKLPSNALKLGPNNLLTFDYIALAYTTKDGKKANSSGKTIQGNLAPERVAQFQQQGMGFKNELELGPGEYTVRFVVRDNVTGRVGSVSAPLTVN
jgi:VWFA-related protein